MTNGYMSPQRLETLISISYGKGLKSSDRNENGSVEVYGSGGLAGHHDVALIETPTIIIGRKGSIGEAYLTKKPSWPIDTTYYVDKINPDLLIDYLFYFLKSLDFSSMNRSAAIPGIRRNDLYDLNIPIPHLGKPEKSLEEQHRIVARIESLFSEVEHAQKLHTSIVKDTEQLMDAVLGEVYGPSTSKLQDSTQVSLSDLCFINPRKPRIDREDDQSTSFVPMAAVDEYLGAVTETEIKPYSDLSRGYTYFEENDVCFAKITPCMENGKVFIANNLIDGFGFGSTEFHVVRRKPENETWLLPEWIYYFLRQTRVRNAAKRQFRGAVGQQRVPKSFLEDIRIPIPFFDDHEKSLEQQREIVAKFIEIKREYLQIRQFLTNYDQQIEKLQQSILSQAFKGEL